MPKDIDAIANDVFALSEHYDFGELHFCSDKKTGLQAIIAIHNTKLGPALGGARFIEYPSTQAAMRDAMRLARAMSYKSALVGMELGGGKSVIMKPKGDFNRQALFERFGQFIENLNGRYVTAMDSGSTEEDMNIIATKTRHVSSHTQSGGKSGDPSPSTAVGVLYGIQACLKHKYNDTSLEGKHVVIQGVGNVGFPLAKLLHERGARLTVCDVNKASVERCKKEFQAKVIDIDKAVSEPCDVLSPCALGGFINDESIEQFNTPIIAGCANNQLARSHHGKKLFDKGILYAPDYVINAGGIVQAGSIYLQKTEDEKEAKIKNIYHRLLEIFERSDKEKLPTNEITDIIAKELIA